jgi:hypothetical protein
VACDHVRVERWHDTESDRDVWVVELGSVDDWPAKTPWACAGFGLLVAAERVIDVAPLAETAVDQGVAVVCTWGPGCSMIEDMFDEAIVAKNPNETDKDVIITTSHADESLEEAIEFFLAIDAAEDHQKGCKAWCIAAFGPELHAAVTRAMKRRGAKRQIPSR